MRRLLLPALGLLATTALAQVPASVSIRPRIVNGVLTDDFPAVAAVLNGGSAQTATSWCTGTLIGCSTVVTAAHCVCGDRDTGHDCTPDPGARFVFLQHGGVVPVAAIHVHPDYIFPTADLAVLKLGAPIGGIAPVALATAPPPDGTAGTVVGFGRTGAGSDYGLKRVGSVVTSACPSVSLDLPVCWAFDGNGANTCNGDSGGPLLIGSGADATIAGVTSGGESATCAPPDVSWDTSIALYHDWIVGAAAEPLGGSACGGLPAIGDAGTSTWGFTVTLSGATGSVTHAFDVPPGTSLLRVALNGLDDGVADADLWLRAGAAPTSVVADCRVDGPSSFGACTMASPAAGPWYATVVRRAGGGDFQVTASAWGAGSGDVQTCGDGVRAGDEVCDGADASACGGAACAADCSCTVAPTCAAGRVQVLKLVTGRRFRLRARVGDAGGDIAGLDPTTGDVSVALDDGTRHAEIIIPFGDGSWSRSRFTRGIWRWHGDADGLRTVELTDRAARRGLWTVRLRGRDVPGVAGLDTARTHVTLTIGGRCLAE